MPSPTAASYLTSRAIEAALIAKIAHIFDAARSAKKAESGIATILGRPTGGRR